MFRFFHQIRERLINNGKVRNYILYALGEILLVVFGIIIALQINNWNEDRKLRNEMNLYKNSLVEDLKQDSLLITKKVSFLKKDTTELSGFLRRMSSPRVNLDSLTQIARYEYNPSTGVTVAFNDNTISSLRATGDFANLDKKLRSNLLKLIELQRHYESSIALNIAAYLDQAVVYTRKYPFSSTSHIAPNSQLSERIWGKASLEELGALLNGLISVKFALEKGAIGRLIIIKKKINGILADLRKTTN